MATSQTELTAALLLLNTSDSPFVVTSNGNQVVATWNLVDAKWLQIFALASLKETYEITLTLDEANHQISYNERTGSISWVAGVPTISFQADFFSGKSHQVIKKVAFGVKPNLEVGKLYEVDFNTSKIKDPLFQAVEVAGWQLKRSFLEKLFGF